MAAFVKLSELRSGDRAIVREIPTTNPAFVRLREMGLITGTTVTFVRTAPLGDPLEIKIRGYHLSLRKVDAASVMVEPIA